MPFQRKIRVWASSLKLLPTAQAFVAEVATTLTTAPPFSPSLGLGTRFHDVPFHRKISVLGTPSLVRPPLPTAQALRADRAATPDNWLEAPVAGTWARFQLRPFHLRISDLLVVKPHGLQPTAHAFLADEAATPSNCLSGPGPAAEPGARRSRSTSAPAAGRR